MEIRSPESKKEWDDYYSLRYIILRKPLNQPLGSEKNEGDKTGEHFALFSQGRIIGISRLDEVDSTTRQIRFFAIDSAFQGKGLGEVLLKSVELFAKKKKIRKIILQSRENAVHFYQKNGYQEMEKTHLLFGKIQHYLMEKVF